MRFHDGETVAAFARDQVSSRLGTLVFAVRRASEKPDAEAIHDLRVAIRRLLQGLTIFSSLFPPGELKRVERRLKRTLDAAGAVRDRDIALELIEAASLSDSGPLASRIVAEREKLERKLEKRIVKWNRDDFSARWRAGLGLTGQ